MKAEIIKIADDLRNGAIDTETAKTLLLGLFSASKRFLVTYRYTNSTDASLHQDEIEARNCVEACSKVCSNHNYEVEWHTVKEIS